LKFRADELPFCAVYNICQPFQRKYQHQLNIEFIFPLRKNSTKEQPMKFTFTILFLILFVTAIIFPSAGPKTNLIVKHNTVESLLIGLNSDNIGLKSSSAYMIGELKISRAVIPLMKMLHDSIDEELRIAAALALYKIGTPMAINAVKQAIRFDASERVNKHCARFYYDFFKNKITDEDISMVAAKQR
jgi:hypothetical protein